MQGSEEQGRLGVAEGRSIRFTPYAWRRTGLVRSQIYLKVGRYLLICVPLQISFTSAVFLAALTPREQKFFQQFQKKFCSISLAFRGANGKPMTMILRGVLERVESLRQRQNVCVIDVSLASMPSGLQEMLVSYERRYESLRNFYQNFAGRSVGLDYPGAILPGSSTRVTLASGGLKSRATILSIAVDEMTIRLGDPLPWLQAGMGCSLRMFFRGSAFKVGGRITSLGPGRDFDLERVTVALEFSPEIIELLDDYFFRQSIRAAGKAS